MMEPAMRFERELTTYAEPVPKGKFKKGDVYFSVQYADENMLRPIVETLICLGKDRTGGDDSNRVQFQNIESYHQGMRRETSNAGDATFQSVVDGKANHIFEYEKALDELLRCALRRQKQPGLL
jgi:hypothetical protein